MSDSCGGRLGNQIFRNLAVSLIAEKNDLYVDYSYYEVIKQLGIDLFIGKNKFNSKKDLTDDNYSIFYNNLSLTTNLNMTGDYSYFQSKYISNLIYHYLHSDKIKENIIKKNQFEERYNNNNDLFIHIRLGDIERFNPGITYYMKAISCSSFDNIYVSSDSIDHVIIKQIVEKYPNTIIIDYDEIKTFQFASTCKNIILSHGSFSAIIGYLSFFSNIYYPKYEDNKMWYGDMFSIDGWNKIEF